MTKAERTRRYIIERTAPLFNSKGYEGTSLKDLTEVTGLTKGALYGNFHDKEEIAVEAFRYAMAKTKEMLRQQVESALTYKEQLYALLGFYSRYVFDPPVQGGCPLLNTAIEADDHRVSMRPVVIEELMNTVNFIAALLQKGVEAGEFVKEVDVKRTAYIFFCAVEGALMFSRVERSREPMDIIVQHCRTILDQISK